MAHLSMVLPINSMVIFHGYVKNNQMETLMNSREI